MVDERIGTEERITTTTDQSCLSKDNIEHLVEEVGELQPLQLRSRDKICLQRLQLNHIHSISRPQEKMRNFKGRLMARISKRCLTSTLNYLLAGQSQTSGKDEFKHQTMTW